jgi:rod shape-determining protein MreC
MLERFYNFLYLFKEYAVLVTFVVLSLVFLSLNDNAQVKRLRTITVVTFGFASEQFSFIPSYFGLKNENTLLRKINIELADEVQRLREAKLENIRLRQLTGIRSASPHTLAAARVIGKNLTLLRNTLTINLGAADGLKTMMPVVGDGGLVGLVTAASDHYATVNLLLNVDFRVSAKVQRSRVDGIVAWDGNSLVFKNVAKTLDVKTGDVLITSPYSNTFPPEIRIGVVLTVQDQPGSLFKQITVAPSVDFIKLEEVFVVNYQPEQERLELEKKISGGKR